MEWPWSSLRPRPPWYAAGLAFECSGCGRCCAGPGEGYVWVSDREIAAVAEFLRAPAEEVRRLYVQRVDGHHSLMERPDNHDCVFLDPPGEGRGRSCRIYAVRPLQCRNWPFWPANLSSPESWSHAAQRCPGVNRGAKFTPEQIHERLRPADPER